MNFESIKFQWPETGTRQILLILLFFISVALIFFFLHLYQNYQKKKMKEWYSLMMEGIRKNFSPAQINELKSFLMSFSLDHIRYLKKYKGRLQWALISFLEKQNDLGAKEKIKITGKFGTTTPKSQLPIKTLPDIRPGELGILKYGDQDSFIIVRKRSSDRLLIAVNKHLSDIEHKSAVLYFYRLNSGIYSIQGMLTCTRKKKRYTFTSHNKAVNESLTRYQCYVKLPIRILKTPVFDPGESRDKDYYLRTEEDPKNTVLEAETRTISLRSISFQFNMPKTEETHKTDLQNDNWEIHIMLPGTVLCECGKIILSTVTKSPNPLFKFDQMDTASKKILSGFISDHDPVIESTLI